MLMEQLEKGWRNWKSEMKKRDHPDYGIVKIGLNTEQSSGDPRKLAVTQTSVKDHQLTLKKNANNVLHEEEESLV